MQEFTIGSNTYRVRKMDAVKQFHIARRLTPLIGALIASLPPDMKKGDKIDLKDVFKEDDALKMLAPLTSVVSQMSDADSEYIIFACLESCDRSLGADRGWAAVKKPGHNLQYQDIDMAAMLQIVWKAIQENLGNFFPAPSPASTE